MIKRFAFLACLMSLLLFACEKEIQLDLPDQQKLVVLSNFGLDSTFLLHLSATQSIAAGNHTGLPFPSRATIKLFENGDYIEDLTFQASEEPEFTHPHYFSKHIAKEDATYQIEVSAPGFPSVTAENSIPAVHPIERFEVVSALSRQVPNQPDALEVQVKTRLQIAPSSEEKMYFHLKAYQNAAFFNVIGNDTIINRFGLFELDPDIPNTVDHLELLHESGTLLDKQAFIKYPEGIEIAFSLSLLPGLEIRSPIIIELRRVSEDYYLFHKNVGEQEISNLAESVLAPQAVLIHNNIEGGIGYFGGYSVTIDSTYW